MAAALVALAGAHAAEAAHMNTTVYAEARGLSSSTDSRTIGGIAEVWQQNDILVTGYTSVGGGAIGEWSATVSSPKPYTVQGTTAVVAGPGAASASALASLDSGEMKVRTETLSFGGVGSTTFASARIRDAIWFTNTTADFQPITLQMGVDGGIGAGNGRAELFSYIGINSVGGGGNDLGQWITANPDGTGSAQFALYGDIDANATGDKLTFRDQLSGKVGAEIPWWNFTSGGSHNPALGVYDYAKTITLWVPTGETTLVIDSWLNLTLCNGTRICDFGNTAAIRFGALPEGLSWTSQSGVFLSALPQVPGGIPEPATWAMLIAGFGFVGVAARRRRAAVLS
jgi:hypothetical protein